MSKALKILLVGITLIGSQPVTVTIDGESEEMTLAVLLTKEAKIIAGVLALVALSLVKTSATKTEVSDDTKIVKKSPKVVMFG